MNKQPLVLVLVLLFSSTPRLDPSLLDAATAVMSSMAIVHVDPVNGWDSTTCGYSTSPCRSVQQAFSRVANGGIIKLAQGTYVASGAAPAVLDITFGPGDPGKDFTVQGGFVPPNWNAPIANPMLSILDGEGYRRVVNIVSVPSVRVTLSNLSIVRGFVNTPNSSTGEFIGGGVQCRNDHPSNSSLYVQLTLQSVNVMSNTVQGYGNRTAAGGGVAAYLRCWLILRQTYFAHNQVIGGNAPDNSRGAQALGGGLFATMSSGVDAQGVIFERNQAIAGYGGQGFAGSNTLDRADALGGGATFQYNWVYIRSARFLNNEARAGWGTQYGGFGTGGAVLFEFAEGTIEDSVFIGNLSLGGNAANRAGEGHGGAIFAVNSQVRVNRAQIRANKAIGGSGAYAGHGGGGGIYVTRFNAPSAFHGENLEIAYNAAEAGQGNDRWGGGGGVYIQNMAAWLTHTTIASNTVLSTMLAPAAIVQYGSGTMRLTHSIVSHHTSGLIAAVLAHAQGTVDAYNNLVWSNIPQAFGTWNGTLTAAGMITANPLFVSASNFDILSASPAVNQAMGSTTSRDILGRPRPYGVNSDLGAYEYYPPYNYRAHLPLASQ